MAHVCTFQIPSTTANFGILENAPLMDNYFSKTFHQRAPQKFSFSTDHA
jgi:hypothetical protein